MAIEVVDTVDDSMGIAPAIVMVNTKYGHNVAGALRLASCTGIRQLWITGDRWAEGWEKRMPREERMKAYGDVKIFRTEDPLRAFNRNVTPIAVEVMEKAVPLPYFDHPDNAVYVFGPEDGSLPDWAKRNCHQHVIIPTKHCLNLTNAITWIMADRSAKRYLEGKDEVRASYDTLTEQRGFYDSDAPLRW